MSGWKRSSSRFWLGMLATLALPAVAQKSDHEGSASPSGEKSLHAGTQYASYLKVPLVEGHGSFFDKAISLQDPVTKAEVLHDNAVLEIINGLTASAILQCGNLATAWGGDEAKVQSGDLVCGNSDFLVKVWPTSSNQAKAYSCYCASKETYRLQGKPAESVRGYARPAKGQHLALIPLTPKVTAIRPDGSLVEAERMEGVFAQDLGPGPVDLNLGARMRYMRFFKKNASGQFVPLNRDQDAIYQVLDSGLVSSDIPTTHLAQRRVLRRADGTDVSVDRVSTDMWLRPKYMDPKSGELLVGSIVHTASNGLQAPLNSNLYAMPASINGEDFGLMSRMRGQANWSKLADAKVGEEPSPRQVLKIKMGARPPRSNRINTALPIVSDRNTATKTTGYYTHTYGDNYVWGNPHVIWNIKESARRAKAQGITMGIGDINRKPKLKPHPKPNKNDSSTYAFTPPHSSHNYGRAVDMRFIAHNGMATQGTTSSAHYSREKTLALIKIMIDVDHQVESIYIDDDELLVEVRAYLRQKGITGVRTGTRGHHDHLHISWKN